MSHGYNFETIEESQQFNEQFLSFSKFQTLKSEVDEEDQSRGFSTFSQALYYLKPP